MYFVAVSCKNGTDQVVSIPCVDQTGKENRGEMAQSGFLQLVRPNEGLVFLLLGRISSFETAEKIPCIEQTFPRNASYLFVDWSFVIFMGGKESANQKPNSSLCL